MVTLCLGEKGRSVRTNIHGRLLPRRVHYLTVFISTAQAPDSVEVEDCCASRKEIVWGYSGPHICHKSALNDAAQVCVASFRKKIYIDMSMRFDVVGCGVNGLKFTPLILVMRHIRACVC